MASSSKVKRKAQGEAIAPRKKRRQSREVEESSESSELEPETDDEKPQKGRGSQKRRQVHLDPVLHLGRYAPRWIHPYLDMGTVLRVGLHEGVVQGDPKKVQGDPFIISLPQDIYAQNLAAFRMLFTHSESLLDVICEIATANDEAAFDDFIDKLRKGFKSAFSTDTNRIRHALPNILIEDVSKPLIPPIPPNTNKENRGLNHPTISALLIPQSHIAEYITVHDQHSQKTYTDAKNRVVQALMDGDIPVCDSDLPLFLFDMKKFDPDSLNESFEKSLFRGFLPIQVARYILINPSAATGKSKSIKPGNAKCHGVRWMTREAILYSILHTRFAMSQLDRYDDEEELPGIFEDDENDGDDENSRKNIFSFPRFYDMLAEVYDSATDDWRRSVLDFWNQEVFGRVPDSLPGNKRKVFKPNRTSGLELFKASQTVSKLSQEATELEKQAAVISTRLDSATKHARTLDADLLGAEKEKEDAEAEFQRLAGIGWSLNEKKREARTRHEAALRDKNRSKEEVQSVGNRLKTLQRRVQDAIDDVERAKNDCLDLERKALDIKHKVKAAWKEVEVLRNKAESARKKAQAARKQAESARSSAPPDSNPSSSRHLVASRPPLSSTAPSSSKAVTPTESSSESRMVSRKPNSDPSPSRPTPFLDTQIPDSDHDEGDPANNGDMDHDRAGNADHAVASPTSALLSKYTKSSPKNLHQSDGIRHALHDRNRPAETFDDINEAASATAPTKIVVKSKENSNSEPRQGHSRPHPSFQKRQPFFTQDSSETQSSDVPMLHSARFLDGDDEYAAPPKGSPERFRPTQDRNGSMSPEY